MWRLLLPLSLQKEESLLCQKCKNYLPSPQHLNFNLPWTRSELENKPKRNTDANSVAWRTPRPRLKEECVPPAWLQVTCAVLTWCTCACLQMGLQIPHWMRMGAGPGVRNQQSLLDLRPVLLIRRSIRLHQSIFWDVLAYSLKTCWPTWPVSCRYIADLLCLFSPSSQDAVGKLGCGWDKRIDWWLFEGFFPAFQ